MSLAVVGASGLVGHRVVTLLDEAGNGPAVLANAREDGVPSGFDGVESIIIADDGDLFAAASGSGLTRTLETARAAAKAGVDTIVYASSTLVYAGNGYPIDSHTLPRPESPYGRAKLHAETGLTRLASDMGARLAVVRLPHVYGAASVLFDYVARSVLPFAGDSDSVFSHLHVDDAARALIAAAESRLDGVVAVADRSPVSWSRFFAVVGLHRPGFRVIPVEPERRDRALRLLGWDRTEPLPSTITPGTGLGCRFEQRIDPTRSWSRLGIEPRHETIESGIAAVMGELGDGTTRPAGVSVRSAVGRAS